MTILKNFAYILILVISTSIITLYISKASYKKNTTYKCIVIFYAAMFVYVLNEMLLSSHYISMISMNNRHFLILPSNIAFIIIILSWLRVVCIFSDKMNMNQWVCLIKCSIVYGFITVGLSIVGIFIDQEACINIVSLIIMIFDTIFDFTIILISIVLLKRPNEHCYNKKKVIFTKVLGLILIIYMIYTVIWDIRMPAAYRRDFSIFQEFDIALVIYAIVCILLMAMFNKGVSDDITEELYKVIGIKNDKEKLVDKVSYIYDLSQREEEVTRLLIKGRSNPEIADELFISKSTVKYHVGNIYQKTGTKTRFELMTLIRNI